MDIDSGKLNILINEIVGRTLSSRSGVLDNETAGGTLALLTSCVPFAKNAAYALAGYGGNVECALFGEAEFENTGFPQIKVFEGNTQQLLKRAEKKERIVLVAPKICLLERIAQGDDGSFAEHVFLRSLLWGKKACILLDFAKPKFKRGTFFEKISDTLDMLASMGVEITNYACLEEKQANAYSLVTENDVTDAGKRGEASILLAKGAIVTPLASEKARELNITLDR